MNQFSVNVIKESTRRYNEYILLESYKGIGEQLRDVYNTYYKNKQRQDKIDSLYNDILLGIEEVEDNTGCLITVSKSILYLNKGGNCIEIDFVNDDSSYELFLNTVSLEKYTVRFNEVSEDDIVIRIDV